MTKSRVLIAGGETADPAVSHGVKYIKEQPLDNVEVSDPESNSFTPARTTQG
jgi:hypothetical protein